MANGHRAREMGEGGEMKGVERGAERRGKCCHK